MRHIQTHRVIQRLKRSALKRLLHVKDENVSAARMVILQEIEEAVSYVHI